MSKTKSDPQPIALDKRKIHLNSKLLIILVVALVGVGVGSYFLRQFNLVRSSEALKERALAAHDKGDFDEAVKLLSRYVELQPGKQDYLLMLGEWIDESATTMRSFQRAYQLLDRALTLEQFSKREDLRRRVVILAVKLQRFRDALNRIDEVCEKGGGGSEDFCSRDRELMYIRARCAEELGEYDRTVDEYVRSIKATGELGEGPANSKYSNVDFFVGLISFLDKHGDRVDEDHRKMIRREVGLKPEKEPVEGDVEEVPTTEYLVKQLLDAMVLRAKPSYRGLLARGVYFREHNQLVRAAEDIKGALELEGKNGDVLLQAIETEMAQANEARLTVNGKNYAEHIRAANELVARARDSSPDDLRLYLSLSRVTLDSGRAEEAEEHVREGLKRFAERPEKDRKSPPNLDLEYRLNWMLANVLIVEAFPPAGEAQEKKVAEAEEVIEHLKTLNGREAVIDYLRARILMGRRNWKDAVEKLTTLRDSPGEFPDTVRNIDLSLALCYERLGLPENRLIALQRAVEVDPYWIPTRIELARALVAVGRPKDALVAYKDLQQVPSVPLLTARILMQQQLQLLEPQRNWTAVEKVVRAAEQIQPRTAESYVLRGELLFHQKKFDEAADQFELAITREPELGLLWTGLVGLMLRRSDLEPPDRIARAQEVLKRAEAALPNRVEVALLQADVALAQGPEAVTPVLKSLEDRAGEFSVSDRITLFRGLAGAWDANRVPAETVRLLERAADLAPDDVLRQMDLGEWAIRDSEDAVLGRALERTRKIEGPNGPNADFLEGYSILVQIQKKIQKDGPKLAAGDLASLAEAFKLLKNAGNVRRNWAAVPRSLGILEALRENRSASIEHFRKAFEMGDRSRETLFNIFNPLYQEKQYDEILAESRRISQEAPALISGDVGRIVALAAYESRQYRDALEYAKKLGADSSDYRDQVIQAQFLSADPKTRSQAEPHFRKAVELAPAVPQVWAYLVGYLAADKRKEEALQVIGQAEEKVPAEPKHLRPQTLAACYAMIGDRKEAERNYQAAQTAAPENIGLVNDTMIFYLRGGELERADAELEKMLDPTRKVDDQMRDAALRTRALISASRGGSYDEMQKAIRDIDGNREKGTGEASVADLRAKAMLLARSQFRRDRDRLIECVEKIDQRGEATEAEKFQLAQLYDQAGRTADAQARYIQLIEADTGNIAIRVAWAVSRLKSKDLTDEALAEVERTVELLERKEPRSFRTTLLRAQLLDARGKRDEAVPLLRQFLREMKTYRPEELFRDLIKQQKTGEALNLMTQIAGRKNDQSMKVIVEQARKLLNGGEEQEALSVLQRYVALSDVAELVQAEVIQQVASILEAYGQSAAAEETFRLYVSRVKPVRPDAGLVLAAFLARQKRIDEALEQCREVSQNAATPRMISVSMGVLRAGAPNAEQIASVEKQILGALEQAMGPDAIPLSISLADLRDLQGRYDETIAIYRSILDKDSNNLVALNNLAWMLSFMPGDRDVCLPLINRAIQLRGPMVDLIDTRAVILLNLNKTKDAMKDLDAAYEEVASPSILFHMAQAHLRAGNVASARDKYRQAEQSGFNPSSIHPLERPGFDELMKGIGDNQRARN